ncbi:hypothetical protein CE91St30_15100 [Raoultibacter timonensis]|uniref:Uncharacterized protein n=1 Tax=Raoultibacter timonensis TaxID=1907662 RepID=A0ABN6MHD9_9ACTN|nr:hypothetical protein CE91St30_15100 [Raoultibacter timonensis]BDF50782.1 hypothetical protein CE91St31_15120 [Raoultibacter timonensis]
MPVSRSTNTVAGSKSCNRKKAVLTVFDLTKESRFLTKRYRTKNTAAMLTNIMLRKHPMIVGDSDTAVKNTGLYTLVKLLAVKRVNPTIPSAVFSENIPLIWLSPKLIP